MLASILSIHNMIINNNTMIFILKINFKLILSNLIILS